MKPSTYIPFLNDEFKYVLSFELSVTLTVTSALSPAFTFTLFLFKSPPSTETTSKVAPSNKCASSVTVVSPAFVLVSLTPSVIT